MTGYGNEWMTSCCFNPITVMTRWSLVLLYIVRVKQFSWYITPCKTNTAVPITFTSSNAICLYHSTLRGRHRSAWIKTYFLLPMNYSLITNIQIEMVTYDRFIWLIALESRILGRLLTVRTAMWPPTGYKYLFSMGRCAWPVRLGTFISCSRCSATLRETINYEWCFLIFVMSSFSSKWRNL